MPKKLHHVPNLVVYNLNINSNIKWNKLVFQVCKTLFQKILTRICTVAQAIVAGSMSVNDIRFAPV